MKYMVYLKRTVEIGCIKQIDDIIDFLNHSNKRKDNIRITMSSSGSSSAARKMSALWEKTKAGTKAAADATQKAAQRAKLKTEISMLKRSVAAAKTQFGTESYDLYANNKTEEAAAVLAKYKTKIDMLEQQISAKRKAVVDLSDGGRDSIDDEDEADAKAATSGDGAVEI